MYTSYTTLNGSVLDLTALTEEQCRFFAVCVQAWRAGATYLDFLSRISGVENPLVRDAAGVITRAVYRHSLFQALRDIEDRIGIATGYLLADPDADLAADPLVDQWLPARAVAATKGVSVQAVHQAIGRGELVSHQAAGRRWLVSERSALAWTPNTNRQAAGRSPGPRRGRQTVRVSAEEARRILVALSDVDAPRPTLVTLNGEVVAIDDQTVLEVRLDRQAASA